jgi:hypothetical protein
MRLMMSGIERSESSHCPPILIPCATKTACTGEASLGNAGKAETETLPVCVFAYMPWKTSSGARRERTPDKSVNMHVMIGQHCDVSNVKYREGVSQVCWRV